MQATTCDRCGKSSGPMPGQEIDNLFHIYDWLRADWREVTEGAEVIFARPRRSHLCPACTKAFVHWVERGDTFNVKLDGTAISQR